MKNSIEGLRPKGFDTNFLVPLKFTQPDNFVLEGKNLKYIAQS
jgi:hypothetical protein